MNKNMLAEFMKTGISVSNDPEIFKFVEPIIDQQVYNSSNSSEYYLVAEKNQLLTESLEKTSMLLCEKYFQILFKNNDILYTSIGITKLVKSSLWKGLDNSANAWHNDYYDTTGVCDLAFLCYFNNFSSDTGGEFQFRNVNNLENLVKMYPRKYDIILFNQQSEWNHKVTPLASSNVERTVMLFGYTCEL